jgi:hypothetical protein
MINNYRILLPLVLILSASTVKAQTINWASLTNEHTHVLNANVGVEHGVTYGIGYGFHIKTKLFPIVATTGLSFPSGNNLHDDFKAKAGAQIRLVEYRTLQFTANLHGVFRRQEQELVRLVNFGADVSGVAGYYRPKWFVAGEVGFDKAIATQFKHSNLYREQFAGAVDGWYEPATGGNFYYGLQTGFSFKRHDITLRAGKMLTQDFKTTPFVPYYAQLGYNVKF